MTLHLSQSCSLPTYSLTERLLAATSEATRAAVNSFQQAWRAHPAPVDEGNSLDLMADIDAHTLRDIGAPNWLIAQAIERKDAHHLRLFELYRS